MATTDREFIERSVRVGIVTATVVLGIAALLWLAKGALTPLVAAFVLAYFFDPLIDRFEKHRIPRAVAIFLLLTLAGIVVAGSLVYLIPFMQRSVAELAQRFPGYVDRFLTQTLPSIESTFGVKLPQNFDEAVETLRASAEQVPFDTLQSALAQIITDITGSIAAMIGLLVIPVIAFYFLVNFDTMKLKPLALVPPRHRDYVVGKFALVDQMVAGFLRGQLTVCLILGVLYAVGFTLIGIDLALVIGLAAGLLAIVPYLGNIVALGTAAGMSILEFGWDIHLLLVIGWYVLCQNLEGFILTPRIVGGQLKLHPVTVMVALLVGADLLGFLGMLIAVPTAAVVKVFISEIIESYQASSFYSS